MTSNARRNQTLRIPTYEDYLSFDGAHCRSIYAALAADWTCPGCGRNTYQVLRWTMRFPKSPNRFEGWAAGYHTHHDHSTNYYRYALTDRPKTPPRFPDTIICEQCNSADGMAKRKLKLPSAFSFSPSEIRQFVSATPHGFHQTDYAKAQAIFDQLGLRFEP